MVAEAQTVLRGRIVLEDGILEDGIVAFRGETIQYVGPPLTEYTQSDDLVQTDGYIWPGLIDLHVHGAGGCDVMDATPDAIETISRTLGRYGVTGFLATTVTGEKRQLERAMENVVQQAPYVQNGAEVLGIHLEGPWICPERCGAQNPEFIVDPEPEDAEWAMQHSEGTLRIVTIAPERPGAMETIRALVDKGVIVSVGHSDATYEETVAAAEAGATHLTHCFNGMRGLHHREPGVVGAGLEDDRFCLELIADGYHVHPGAIRLLLKAKGPDGVMLISDGMRAVGMPEGEYELGGLPVISDGETVRLENGALAGSLLTLDAAVRNVVEFGKAPLYQAVKMASLTPAKRIGVDGEMGSIREGKLADLVVVDEQCRVQRVWSKGKEIYTGNDQTK